MKKSILLPLFLFILFTSKSWALQFDMVDFFQVNNTHQVYGIAYNQDEFYVGTKQYLSGSWKNTIIVVDPNTHQTIRTLNIENISNQWFGGLEYYSGNLVLGVERTYYVVSPNDGSLIESFYYPPPVQRPVYNDDNKRIFSLAKDNNYLLSTTQGFNADGWGVTYLNMIDSNHTIQNHFVLLDDPSVTNDQLMAIGVYKNYLLGLTNLSDKFYLMDYLNGGSLIDSGFLNFSYVNISGMAVDGEDIYLSNNEGLIVKLREGQGSVLPDFPQYYPPVPPISTIPEPSSLSLLMISLIGLGLSKKYYKETEE